MLFDEIKNELTRKVCELKLWLANIDERNQYCNITKGLYFVYMYGIYEETIRQVVSTTIDELNNAEVKLDECVYELYSLIFSDEYDGMYNVGNEHKWEKRWKLSDKMINNPKVVISHDMMPTDGKNIRYKQLKSIANSFGMKENVLPRNEIGGYIQEMVDNRNYIAHGNKTPKEVGRNFTILDLKNRCDYMEEVRNYVIAEYEAYIQERKYLRR